MPNRGLPCGVEWPWAGRHGRGGAPAGQRWVLRAIPAVTALVAVGLALGFTLPSEAGPGPSPSPAPAEEPVAATTAEPPALPQVTRAEAPSAAHAVSVAAEPPVKSPCPPVPTSRSEPQVASAAPRRASVVPPYDGDDDVTVVEGRIIRASI